MRQKVLRCWTLGIMVIVYSLMIFSLAFSYAQEAGQHGLTLPVCEEGWHCLFEDVRYKIEENRMVIIVNQPMMIDRFAAYGQARTDPKTRQTAIDETNKDLQTDIGMRIRVKILDLRTKRGLPLVTTCVLTQDAIAVFKKDRYTWDRIEPMVLEILQLLR